jgi:hypothetical protein
MRRERLTSRFARKTTQWVTESERPPPLSGDWPTRLFSVSVLVNCEPPQTRGDTPWRGEPCSPVTTGIGCSTLRSPTARWRATTRSLPMISNGSTHATVLPISWVRRCRRRCCADPGFGWRAGEVVAVAVLRFLADQVHVPPSAVGDYANWPQTRIEHTANLHSGRGSRRRHQSRPGTHGQCKPGRHLGSTRLTQSWYLSEENYRAALARIIKVHHAQPFARQWGRRPSLLLGRTFLSIRPSPERGGRDQRQVRTRARLANLHPPVGQARLVQRARALGHVVGGALRPRWTCGPTGRRALRRHRRRHRPRVRAVSSPGLPVRAAFPGSARSPLRHHRAK